MIFFLCIVFIEIIYVQEGKLMEKGYVENGFIVDLAHAKKASEVLYELSKVLDMPEAKNKSICLKLGELNLTKSNEKALVFQGPPIQHSFSGFRGSTFIYSNFWSLFLTRPSHWRRRVEANPSKHSVW